MSSATGTVLFLFRFFFRLETASNETRGFFALISEPARSQPCSTECVLFLPTERAPEDMLAEEKGLSHNHNDVTSPLFPRPTVTWTTIFKFNFWFGFRHSLFSFPHHLALFSLRKHSMSLLLPLAILSLSVIAAPISERVGHSSCYWRLKLILSQH